MTNHPNRTKNRSDQALKILLNLYRARPGEHLESIIVQIAHEQIAAAAADPDCVCLDANRLARHAGGL
jgi:hypothetical protein